MQKSLTITKKIIFSLLMLYMLCGLTFFFIFTCSSFSFVSDFIYEINRDYYFYNDGIIFPLVVFVPEAFVITALVWIFFRKETTVLLRGIITVIPFWQLISFLFSPHAFGYYAPISLKILNIFPVAGFIVIYYFLFRELNRLFRKSSTFFP